MTNLSKELCEICGIKPRYGVYQNFGDLDSDYRLVTNVRKYRLIADTRFNVDDEDLRNLKPIYYPDFEQSENFVKLLKIANDVLGRVHFATAYTKNKPGIFEEQVLLHYLPIAKLNEGFKRAIRAEEWVYE